MQNRLLFISLIFAAIFFLICLSNPFGKRLEKGTVVINVLSKELYDDCHIKGSISVPFDDTEEYVLNNIDKNADIILYCSNYLCTASGYMTKKLIEHGFKHVWAYEGGTAEWYQQRMPVNGLCVSSYLKNVLVDPKKEEKFPTISLKDLAKKMGVDIQPSVTVSDSAA